MPTTTTGTATSFITFSRASTATRINASGLIEAVASGAARIDYDPVTLAAKGLLVEEQRSNVVLNSSAFGSWTNNAVTVNADTLVAPDGTTTADELVRTTSTSDSRYQTVTFTGDGTKSVSIYVKYNTSPSFMLFLYDSTAVANRMLIEFSFTAGVPSASTVSNGSVEAIENFGSGWYRIKVLCTGVVAANTNIIYVYPARTGSANLQKTSFWGVQGENGSFATSYIPTTSASVTRSADVASVATSAFPYSATEGTLIIKATPPNYAAAASGGINPTVAVLNDGTLNNRIMVLRGAGATDPTFRVSVAGVDQALFSPASTGTWPNGTTRTVAVAWAANDFAGCINGGAVATDTSGTIPTVNTLALGNINGVGHLNGHIRQITYVPRRLTNAELQARTA